MIFRKLHQSKYVQLLTHDPRHTDHKIGWGLFSWMNVLIVYDDNFIFSVCASWVLFKQDLTQTLRSWHCNAQSVVDTFQLELERLRSEIPLAKSKQDKVTNVTKFKKLPKIQILKFGKKLHLLKLLDKMYKTDVGIPSNPRPL